MSNPDQQKRLTAILKAELEAKQLRPLLYRMEEDTVTVALLLKKGTLEPVSRGLSIQSPDDQSYHRDGNNRAIGRALKAARLESTDAPIRPYERKKDGTPDENKVRKPHLVAPYKTFVFKRTYLPNLTEEEEMLLEKLKKSLTK